MATDLMGRLHEWDSWAEWEPANNDLDPTSLDPLDYSPFWDTGPEWWHPHPLIEGYTCSTGFEHVAHPLPPTPPVGLARITDLPPARSTSHCRTATTAPPRRSGRPTGHRRRNTASEPLSRVEGPP